MSDLIGKVFQQAIGYKWSRHAEAAGAGGFHHLTDIDEFRFPRFQVVWAGRTGEAFGKTLGADPTGEAFATGFLGKEFHSLVGDRDHISALVEDHDAPSSQHRTSLADRGLVERGIEIATSEKSAR